MTNTEYHEIFIKHFYIERTFRLNRVHYHFAIFAIINKILITKNCRIYWSLIIFCSNTINFTEKLQEIKIVYFFLVGL